MTHREQKKFTALSAQYQTLVEEAHGIFDARRPFIHEKGKKYAHYTLEEEQEAQNRCSIVEKSIRDFAATLVWKEEIMDSLF